MSGGEILAFDRAIFDASGFKDYCNNDYKASTASVNESGILCAGVIETAAEVIFDTSQSYTLDMLYSQTAESNLVQFNFMTYMKTNPDKTQLLMQNQWNGSTIRAGVWYGTGGSRAEQVVANSTQLAPLKTLAPVQFKYVYDADTNQHAIYIDGDLAGYAVRALRAVSTTTFSIGHYGPLNGPYGIIDKVRLRPGVFLND